MEPQGILNPEKVNHLQAPIPRGAPNPWGGPLQPQAFKVFPL